MTWGFFSVTHIITLLLAVVALFGLHFLLRGRSRKFQLWVMGPLSFLGIASILYNLLAFGSPLENLPLHLCSFNAVVLPIVVFTKNKTLGNVLLVWCLGALAALVLNNEMAETKLLGWPFFFYYFPHVVEFIFPILMVSLGHVKKDPKCILSTIGITMGIYTLVHFANVAINSYCTAEHICNPQGEVVFANYMYSIAPNNPLCELFQKLIPGTYWYMYLVVPIVVVYLLIVYAPEIIAIFKKKKCAVGATLRSATSPEKM